LFCVAQKYTKNMLFSKLFFNDTLNQLIY